MKRLKIIAILRTNPIINNELYFDGILYYALRKYILKQNYYNLPRFSQKILKKIKLPIKRKNKVYLASKSCYKLKEKYIIYWRKRWNEISAQKWCINKRIYINQKYTKNYNFPIEISILKNNKIWWYVIGNKKIIIKLLKEVIGIGKEINQGYGLIKKWKIKETNHKGVRLFPIIYKKNLPKNEIIERSSCYPPYSNRKNIKECIWRKF